MLITEQVGRDTFEALAKHWSAEKTARGKLAREYLKRIKGYDADIDGPGIYALIRFVGAELGIVPQYA